MYKYSLPERLSKKIFLYGAQLYLMLGDLLLKSSQEKTDGRMKLEMCKIQINTEDNLVQGGSYQPIRGPETSH